MDSAGKYWGLDNKLTIYASLVLFSYLRLSLLIARQWKFWRLVPTSSMERSITRGKKIYRLSVIPRSSSDSDSCSYLSKHINSLELNGGSPTSHQVNQRFETLGCLWLTENTMATFNHLICFISRNVIQVLYGWNLFGFSVSTPVTHKLETVRFATVRFSRNRQQFALGINKDCFWTDRIKPGRISLRIQFPRTKALPSQ